MVTELLPSGVASTISRYLTAVMSPSLSPLSPPVGVEQAVKTKAKIIAIAALINFFSGFIFYPLE
jgi:hypothetical protein